MNLDDYSAFQSLDPENMLGEIDGLPGQLEQAWNLGMRLPLPTNLDVRQVLIAGMGGSAIGADLLAAYLQASCRVPVIVHRDYGLPAWAHGPQTLVIASSHSGNTEETLSSFEQAQAQNCRCMVVSTGGKLAALADRAGLPVWKFEHGGQPRAAVGFSFGLLLAAFVRLNLVAGGEEVESELQGALAAMRKQQDVIRAESPVNRNMAKRIAGQFMGRWVSVFGAGILAPVARRWKGQISEVAKAWAQFEFLPEADHNTLAGTVNPEDLFSRSVAIFLQSPTDHPRNRLRLELTRKIFMLEGIPTDFYDAQGASPLANLWTALHFGDYLAYYLAMAYQVDPTPVAALQNLKAELSKAS